MTLKELLQDEKAVNEILERENNAKDDEEIDSIFQQEIRQRGIETNEEETHLKRQALHMDCLFLC